VTGRRLHALLLPPATSAGRLLDALASALDGSGPAILPLDPGLPEARVAALLDAFAPATVETPGGTERWPPSDGGAGAGAVAVPDEVAVVIATSGSTGEPKGVQLTAGALLHSARASLDRIGARAGERWLCPLPASHVAGLGILVRSLVSGTTPVLVAGTDGMGQAGCAYVSLVPTQLRRLLAAGADLAGFATILLGGAAVPAGLLAAARSVGARVVTTYGMSETCGGCVYDGVPLAGVSARTGAGGRIALTGPVLFSGYRLRPDLTRQAMADGWFVTSDIGAVDAAGRLSVRGRADEMINTGGEKVAPGEVAAALEGCPGVREAAVIGQPDPEWGERVTAVVVPDDPAHPPDLAALRTAVTGRLPRYAAPRALVLVADMPLLASGKPDLAALRRLSQGTPEGRAGE
jgi:o-succinylbenzoate---CoA ligase